MDATFRLRRTFRNQGLGFLPVFLAWFAGTLYLFGTDQKIPYRLAAAAGMGIVPLFMAGLSAWMLAAYWREELTIQGERVTFRGIFREKAVHLGGVTQAKWRTGSTLRSIIWEESQSEEVIEAKWRTGSAEGGSLVLRTESTRLAISLNNYEDEEREQIISHMRSVLPPEIQVGWNLFAYKAELRAKRAARTKPGPDEVVLSRDRWDRYLMPSLAVASVAGVVAWWFTGNLGNLAFPLVILPLWAMLRFMTPAEGVIVEKLSASRKSDFVEFAWFCLVWVLVAMAGVMINEHFRPRMAQIDAIAIVGLVVWFGVLFFEAYRLDRRVSRREREAADQAAKARGDSAADPWRAE